MGLLKYIKVVKTALIYYCFENYVYDVVPTAVNTYWQTISKGCHQQLCHASGIVANFS